MNINQNYREAVKAIKEAILRSQYRAAASANKEQLSLYYGIGRYVSENSRTGFWGKGAIEQISSLLQKELPGLRGFSVSNIKNMRVFYEEWEPVLKKVCRNARCTFFLVYHRYKSVYFLQAAIIRRFL